MYRSVLACMASIVVSFAAASSAAKVVRLYNPWAAYGNAADGAIHLVNYWPMVGFGDKSTTNIFQPVGGGWLEYTFPQGLEPAAGVKFTAVVNTASVPYQSFGVDGLRGGDMDLGTPLATSDTVWIAPSPLPSGSAKVMVSRPREMTVLLWNPFEADARAQRPSMKVESGLYGPMDSVPGLKGWYALRTIGFTNLSLQFRNADSSKVVGATGAGSTLPANFDSLVSRNDTIWVWTSPEPSGAPRAAVLAPRIRTVMLFNPWDGLLPFQRPRIDFGTGGLPMQSNSSYCGWFSFRFIDRLPSVLFSSARTGQTFGATGLGGTGRIDLSAALLLRDTVWIARAAGTGVPVVGSVYAGEKGFCDISLLAATVHDFDSSHPEFEEGTENSCHLTKGMVAPTLGPDRKPLAGSSHCKSPKTGRVLDNGLPTQWFRDVPGVNASTCRDIPLSVNDATGNFAYDDSLFFPIDDFTHLADGTPNKHFQTFPRDGDTRRRNYHFCLESHGEFDYRKGQRFAFRGDDDVWFFIDNKLAVDLGGVHNPESASVLLDTMGLVEGNTYSFDFFYCERQTVNANMRIETSMNLRTPSGFRVLDTVRGPGHTTYDLYIDMKLGQGCQSSLNVQKTPGRFRLSGPQISPPAMLPAGVSYGGITIDPTLSRLTVDSAKMVGLAPGTYSIRILPAGNDTTGARTVTFVVPIREQKLYFVDSLGNDLPSVSGMVGEPRKVWLEVRGVGGMCTTCNQTVGLAATDPFVEVSAIPGGPAIGRVALAGGRASVWVGATGTVVSAPLVAFAESLQTSDTLLLTFSAKAPGSAHWSDVDGDGSVDQLTVNLSHPWRRSSVLQASWPDAAPLFGMGNAALALSPDSLLAVWTFPGGIAPLVTQGPMSRGSLNWDGRSNLEFPIGERVPPVPVRAYLRYGAENGVDTLRIPWSEIVVGGFGPADEMVVVKRYAFWAGTRPLSITRDLASGELVLLYRADDPLEPVPGDSLRFSPSGALRDTLGNVPAPNARRVVVQGTDRAPLSAVMRDADGDGRADRVVLRFRTAPTITQAFAFSWSGPSGIATRIVPADSAIRDSAGRILTFNLDPFAYGWTGCPDSGCSDLGAMISIWGADTSRLSFPVLDEVAPVPVRATLRYNANPAGPDTLIVKTGEPIDGSDMVGSAWFSFGRPSKSPEGRTIEWIGAPGSVVLSPDRRTATFLVDSSFKGVKGDSVRATSPLSRGTISDTLSNRPGTPAGWVPLEFGPHPILLEWKPMPSVREYEDWTPPADEPALQLLVRDPVTGRWTTVGGASPAQDTSHYGGILLKLNRAMKGSVYLYDNLGVFLAEIPLDELALAILAGGVKPDSRGNFEVWVAWNGTSMGALARGRAVVVPSGVYIFRVVAHYEEDGQEVFLNQLFKSGWKRR